jgi:hypothetical protein
MFEYLAGCLSICCIVGRLIFAIFALKWRDGWLNSSQCGKVTAYLHREPVQLFLCGLDVAFLFTACRVEQLAHS